MSFLLAGVLDRELAKCLGSTLTKLRPRLPSPALRDRDDGPSATSGAIRVRALSVARGGAARRGMLRGGPGEESGDERHKNGAATNGGATETAGGRDSGGRFAAGNRGGPGNPFARQTAAARKAIADAVTAEQLAAIAAVMVKKALEGDVAAAKLVFAYAAGKPAPAPDPDTLDAHELAVRRGSAASPEDVQALFEACPASLLCAIAAVAAPQVQEHLQTAFAQGVRRQGECEKRDRKSRRRRRARTPAARPTGRLLGEAGHLGGGGGAVRGLPGLDARRDRRRPPAPRLRRRAPLHAPVPARRAGRPGRRSASVRADHR